MPSIFLELLMKAIPVHLRIELLLTFFCCNAFGQTIDPASNRVFWMSTGKISAPLRGSIGIMGAPYLIPVTPYLTFIQGGYSPTNFLQFNGTGSIGYWSMGAKGQLLQPFGVFQGLAIGFDFGFYPENNGLIGDDQIQSYNVAASVGTEAFQGNVNVVQLVQKRSYSTTPVPTFLQIGIQMDKKGAVDHGTKFMAEIWFVNNKTVGKLELGVLLVGIRPYGRNFVWDLAIIFGPKLSFGHGSSTNKLQFLPLPYVSFMWFI